MNKSSSKISGNQRAKEIPLSMVNALRSTVVVTIDGPAGAGKSTVAKALAKRLGFAYLDTGAMYRALTLKALREKMNLKDESQLVALTKKTTIDITTDSNGVVKVLLDNADVSEAIRSVEVTNNTFYIARTPGVRELMVQRQREIGSKKNVVVEGRDIGTVVFPNAAKKFYLDADFAERSKRRIDELKAKGKAVNEGVLSKELQERDTKDMTRKVGALKIADGAIIIDSTHLTIDQVVEKILSHIQAHG